MFQPTRNFSSLRIRWTWSSDPLHPFYRYIIHPIIYLFTEIKTKGAIHRAVCGSFCVMRRGKIEISKVSGSALAAKICTDPHNRLLRRQHCSSLCSQSEGHEHVANMTSAFGHDFVGFSVHAWPPQYSPPPHFASKVSYSASPQPSAKCPRDASCSSAALAILFD